MANEERTPFDRSREDWVSLQAKSFFFEPYCTQLEFPHPCEIFVTFGANTSRSRGVEIDMWEDGGGASVWVPIGGRVFWRATRLRTAVPIFWEPFGEVREFDYQLGVPYDA